MGLGFEMLPPTWNTVRNSQNQIYLQAADQLINKKFENGPSQWRRQLKRTIIPAVVRSIGHRCIRLISNVI